MKKYFHCAVEILWFRGNIMCVFLTIMIMKTYHAPHLEMSPKPFTMATYSVQ